MLMRRMLFLFAPDEAGGSPPAEPDTATVEPTEPGGETIDTTDWRKRAEDAQAWGTRTAQEAAELRQRLEALESDDQALAELLAKRGYELPDDEPELPDDPTAAQLAKYEQRLEAIEAATQQSAVDRQLAEAEKHFTSAFDALGKDRGSPLSEEEQNAIVGLALTMPPGDDGLPPVKAAAAALDKLWEQREKQWAASKRVPHRVSPNGQAATEVPDRATHDGRVELMMQRLAENQQ